MAGDASDVVQAHRTFLLEGGTAPKVDMKVVIRPSVPGSTFRPGPQPGMGVPNPAQSKPSTQRAIMGFQWVGGHPVQQGLREWDGQRFANYATPFEKDWSVLCPGNERRLAPLVSQNGLVIGHVGTVSTTFIASWPATSAAGGKNRSFVLSQQAMDHLKKAFSRTNVQPVVGFSDSSVTVLTLVDGEVVMEFGGRTRGVEASTVPSPVDIVLGVKVLVQLGAGLGSRLITALQRRSAGKALAGVTDDMITRIAGMEGKDLARELARFGLKVGGYERRMGIPRAHLTAMIEAAKETNMVAVFRANKEAAIELIEHGAVGKPKSLSIPGFKSSKTTGVLTASTPYERAVAQANNYYLVDPDGVARRTILIGGKPVTQELKLVNPYWKKEPGQVIDKSGHPVVGDYDGLGALALESPGRNVVLVPKDPAKGDWLGPDWERYMNAVNPKLDKMRVLHGAQDQFHNPKWGGFTDEVAYAVFPDGQIVILNGRAQQKAFYEAFNRQTAVGSYNAPGVGVPAGMEDISSRGRRR